MFVVADQQFLALRHPSQGSFHQPSPRLATTWRALLPAIPADGPDVGQIAIARCLFVPNRILKPTVQSQFGSCTFTSRRLTTKASIVASSSFISGTRAAAITTLGELPSLATKSDRLVPFLPRSVGFLPTFFPSNRALSSRPSAAYHRQFTIPSSSHSSTKAAQTSQGCRCGTIAGKPAVDRVVIAEVFRELVPLAPGVKSEDNAVDCRSPIDPRKPAMDPRL
jgi:hypothetical protein